MVSKHLPVYHAVIQISKKELGGGISDIKIQANLLGMMEMT